MCYQCCSVLCWLWDRAVVCTHVTVRGCFRLKICECRPVRNSCESTLIPTVHRSSRNIEMIDVKRIHVCTSASNLRMVLWSSEVFFSLVSLSICNSSICLSAIHSFSDSVWEYSVCLSRLSWTHTHTKSSEQCFRMHRVYGADCCHLNAPNRKSQASPVLPLTHFSIIKIAPRRALLSFQNLVFSFSVLTRAQVELKLSLFLFLRKNKLENAGENV